MAQVGDLWGFEYFAPNRALCEFDRIRSTRLVLSEIFPCGSLGSLGSFEGIDHILTGVDYCWIGTCVRKLFFYFHRVGIVH